MDFIATREGIGIRETGTKVTVPNDSIARLMYYLSCCNSCLEVLEKRLTNYQNYYSLSAAEKTAVVALAAILSPDELLDNCFIPVDDNSPLLSGLSNNFYEIERATTVLGGTVRPSGVVMMEGKRVQVRSIMVVTRGWLDKNFIKPFTAEAWRLRQMLEPSNPPPRQIQQPRQQPRQQPQRQITTPTYNNTPSNYSDRDLTPSSREWKRDAYADSCMRRGCTKRFSTFSRRHHCRRCGNIFCGRHCPVANTSHYTRYCVDCE